MRMYLNYYCLYLVELLLLSCNKPNTYEGYQLFDTNIQSVADSISKNTQIIEKDTTIEFTINKIDIKNLTTISNSNVINLGSPNMHSYEIVNKFLEYFSNSIFKENFIDRKDQNIFELTMKKKRDINDSILFLNYLKNLKNITVKFNFRLHYKHLLNGYFDNISQYYLTSYGFKYTYHVEKQNYPFGTDCSPHCFEQGFIMNNKGVLYLFQNDFDETYCEALNEKKIYIAGLGELLTFSILYLKINILSEDVIIIDIGNYYNSKRTYNEIFYPQYKIESDRLTLLLCIVNKKLGRIIKYQFSYSKKLGINIFSKYLEIGKIEYKL